MGGAQRLELTVDDIVEAVSYHRATTWRTALTAVCAFVADLSGPEPGEAGASARFVVQAHSCPDSPVGLCIGDTDTEEYECVFCGKPNERK